MSKIDRMARLDRIKHAIDEDTDAFLSESERTEKMELLNTVSMLLNPLKTTQSIIHTLHNEHGLSDKACFQRITDAKFVFGNVFSQDRALEKMKAFQRAELAWQMAKNFEDVDGMTKANEQMIKLVGADDPNDMIDPTKMEPSVYRAVLPAAEKKVMRALLAGGSLDLGALLSKAGLLVDVVEVAPEEEEEDEQTAP